MPDRIKIRGVEYDASSAPAWFEHFIPGGLRHPRTLKEARDNQVRNLPGNDIENLILWSITGLFVVALIWFLVAL